MYKSRICGKSRRWDQRVVRRLKSAWYPAYQIQLRPSQSRPTSAQNRCLLLWKCLPISCSRRESPKYLKIRKLKGGGEQLLQEYYKERSFSPSRNLKIIPPHQASEKDALNFVLGLTATIDPPSPCRLQSLLLLALALSLLLYCLYLRLCHYILPIATIHLPYGQR